MGCRLLNIILIVLSLPGASICCCALSTPDIDQESCCCQANDTSSERPVGHGPCPERRCPCNGHQLARPLSDSTGVVQLQQSEGIRLALDCSSVRVFLHQYGSSERLDTTLRNAAVHCHGGALLVMYSINRC